MNPVIEKLESWIEELQRKEDFESIEEKSNHIGLINQIDLAIQRIELCKKWEIYPKSIIKELPQTDVTEYRIMEKAITSNIGRRLSLRAVNPYIFTEGILSLSNRQTHSKQPCTRHCIPLDLLTLRFTRSMLQALYLQKLSHPLQAN